MAQYDLKTKPEINGEKIYSNHMNSWMLATQYQMVTRSKKNKKEKITRLNKIENTN